MSFGFGFSLPAYIGYGGGFGAGATLVLDFTSGNQTLDPRITFTRASTATRTNSSGLLESVAINGPRFDYNPSSLAPLGLLIEEQRTNLLKFSEQFDNAAWTKGNSTVTANATVAPDGLVTADKLVENTANSSHFLQNAIGITGGSTYTLSGYVKAAERSVVVLSLGENIWGANGYATAVFDLVNGTGALTSGSTASGFSITNIGSGWYRCTVSGTAIPGATLAVPRFFLRTSVGGGDSYTGDGTSGVFIWGAQLEAGAFATSYIPTTTAAATRAADVATMQEANFSSWYNQSEGSFYVDAENQIGKLTLIADDGSYANRLPQIGISAVNLFDNYVVAAGVVTANLVPAGTNVPGTFFKIGVAYKINDFAASVNGGAVAADTNGALATGINTLRLGRFFDGAAPMTGHIRRIAYWPRKLSSSELQSITA